MQLPQTRQASPTPWHTASAQIKIKNVNDNLCVALQFYEGAPSISFNGCQQGNGSQKWTRASVAHGRDKIEQYPYCLAVGSFQGISKCARGNGNEKFSFVRAAHGLYKIEDNGVCLDIQRVFYACKQGDGNQRWQIES